MLSMPLQGSRYVTHPPHGYDLFLTSAVADGVKLWDLRTRRLGWYLLVRVCVCGGWKRNVWCLCVVMRGHRILKDLFWAALYISVLYVKLYHILEGGNVMIAHKLILLQKLLSILFTLCFPLIHACPKLEQGRLEPWLIIPEPLLTILQSLLSIHVFLAFYACT